MILKENQNPFWGCPKKRHTHMLLSWGVSIPKRRAEVRKLGDLLGDLVLHPRARAWQQLLGFCVSTAGDIRLGARRSAVCGGRPQKRPFSVICQVYIYIHIPRAAKPRKKAGCAKKAGFKNCKPGFYKQMNNTGLVRVNYEVCTA